MPIDVHLLNSLIGSNMGRHGTIDSFIRAVRIIKIMGFFKEFQMFDNTVSIFGIIFSDPCFDIGGRENGHGCKSRIKFFGRTVRSNQPSGRA